MLLEELVERQGGKAASMAYWNALTALRAAWKQVFKEPLPTEGNNAKDAFRQALSLVTQRLAGNAEAEKQLRRELDVEDGELGRVLLDFADLDEVSPNEVKASMLRRCVELGSGKHDLRLLLRPVLDEIFADRSKRSARVGANRHWPRLLLYLRELEEETNWGEDGHGLRLVNVGGGGFVAARPMDPARLAVRIDTDLL